MYLISLAQSETKKKHFTTADWATKSEAYQCIYVKNLNYLSTIKRVRCLSILLFQIFGQNIKGHEANQLTLGGKCILFCPASAHQREIYQMASQKKWMKKMPTKHLRCVLRQFWRPREMMDGHYYVIDIICFIFLFCFEKNHSFGTRRAVVCYWVCFIVGASMLRIV